MGWAAGSGILARHTVVIGDTEVTHLVFVPKDICYVNTAYGSSVIRLGLNITQGFLVLPVGPARTEEVIFHP